MLFYLLLIFLDLWKIVQLLATLSASWTCVGHGLLTGYTAQAIPSMMKEDSTIKMTETHKDWISKFYFTS